MQVDRWTCAPTPEGFTLDGNLFRPARAMAEAALIGEWDGAGDTGNPFATVYKFERGGTFTLGTGQKPGTPGRYRLQGMTLLLTPMVPKTRRTLFIAAKGEPVGYISVEGEACKRK